MTKATALIILIGFKHVGKSTIGIAAAKKLQRSFIDLDSLIEQHYLQAHGHSLSVREIVQQHGKECFQQLEQQALAAALNYDNAIIALGGGTVMAPANQELLAGHCMVHVMAPKDEVFSRIMASGYPASFPQDQDPEAGFEQYWQQRLPIYTELATHTIHNDNSIETAVNSLLQQLNLTLTPRILLLHGPNCNMLGKRDTSVYGSITLVDLENQVRAVVQEHGMELICYQSNYEGFLIDKLQTTGCSGIIINPGAFTHYSYALHDALLDTRKPVIEVHLSNIKQREPWRAISVTAPACVGVVYGKGAQGYLEATTALIKNINAKESNSELHHS